MMRSTLVILCWLLLSAALPAAAAPAAESRLAAVDALISAGRFADALAAARAVAADPGSPRTEAAALLRVSDALYYLGRRGETLAPMEQALAIYTRIDDLEGIGRTYYSLAYYYERTDPTRMLALLAEGRAYAERAGDPRLRMNIANAMGVALWNQGRYDEALVELQASGAIAEQTGDDSAQAAALQNIGLIHLHRGANQPALDAFETALGLVADAESHAVGVILGNCGNAHLDLRDLEAALSCYQRALEIHRRNGYRRGVSTQLNNIASVEEQLGRWDRARLRRLEVVATGREIGDSRTTAGALLALGQLALARGRTAAADSFIAEALAEAQAFGDPYIIARARLNSARPAFARGDTAAGIAWLDSAEAAAARVPDAYTIGVIKSERAARLAAAGRLAAACAELAAAMDLHEGVAARTHLHLWQADLARWWAARGDAEAALGHYRRAGQRIEDLDARIALGEFRVDLFSEVAGIYHDHAALLARLGRPREAWAELDRGRARELTLRILGQQRRDGFSEDELAALGRLSALQRQLRQDDPGGQDRQGLLQGIRAAEEAYENARLAGRRTGPTRRTADFILPRGALTVAYSVHADTMLVFSGDRDRIRCRIVPGAEAILARARRWSELVADPASGDSHLAAGAALRADLLGPELAAGPPRRLVLVPDGGLWALPFAALPGPDGACLSAGTELALTPSLASLAALGTRPHLQRGRIVAAANTDFGAAPDPGADASRGSAALRDLTATTGEAERVAALAPGRATVLHEPGEDAVKALDFASIALLHFATHTLVDRENPDRASIVLAPGGTDDGYLQAREVARLPLACSLVAVSGCGSGAGRAVSGEGLLGLTHALVSAGAHSVVLSRWDVTDVGAAFMMDNFYDALPGRTVAGALRVAQARARASAEWSHPAHWAAFAVAGEGSQRLDLPVPGPPRAVLLGGAAALLITAGALLRRVRAKNRGDV